jgi:hypothetical protein
MKGSLVARASNSGYHTGRKKINYEHDMASSEGKR